jgi:hypothetical protein
MTSRLVRSLQRGRLVVLAGTVGAGLGALVWLAPAGNRRPLVSVSLRAASVQPLASVTLVAGASALLAEAAGAAAGDGAELAVSNPGATMAAFTLEAAGEDTSRPPAASFMLAPGAAQRYSDIAGSLLRTGSDGEIRITVTRGTLAVRSDTRVLVGPGGARVAPSLPERPRPAARRASRVAVIPDGPAQPIADEPVVPPVLASPPGPPLGALDTQAARRPLGRHLGPAGPATPTPAVTPTPTPTPTPSPTPLPTSTPTPTPTPSIPDLGMIVPENWPGCVIANYRPVGPPPVREALESANWTYLYWGVANYGTAGVSQPITFALHLDGKLLTLVVWDPTELGPGGLPAWTYVTFNPVTVTIPAAGQHTIAVTVDPNRQVADTNPANNTCSLTDTWTQPAASGKNLGLYKPPTWPASVVCNERQVGPPPVSESLTAGAPTFVYWSVANFGTATVMEPIDFAVYLDGARVWEGTWNPAPSGGLKGSTYATFSPIQLTIPTGGGHTLSVRADPDRAIRDDDWSNNASGFAGTWGWGAVAPSPPANQQPPINPIDAGTLVMTNLIPLVAASYPPLDDIVSSFLSSGLQPLINQFVAIDPIHRIPVPNGVSLVFGDQPVSTKYGTFTGAATVTLANLQTTASTFSSDFSFWMTPDFTANGQRVAITQATGHFSGSQSALNAFGLRWAGVKTLFDASFTGSGSFPPATEGGSFHVDTSKCKTYPVSGTINFTVGGDRYVITFNDKCDGSFGAQTNPPAQPCNAGQQVAGGDAADSRYFEMGRTSGTFTFDYQTYSQRDRIQVIYEGRTIFDTGCVGESRTGVSISFSGATTVVTVTVTPNCQGGSGTAWNYTLHCPT